MRNGALHDCDAPAAGRDGGEHAAAGQHALYGAAGARRASEDHRSVILELRVDPRAVGGPCGIHEAAIDRGGEHAHGPAGDRYHSESLQRIVDQAVPATLQECDLAAVRAPRDVAAPLWIVVVEIILRELTHRTAGCGSHDVEIPVVGAVGIRLALRDERDRGAVRRPGGQHFVVVAARELREMAGGDVEQPEMHAMMVEIPLDVLLELVAVDDDRMGRAVGVGARIVKCEHHLLSIR